LILGKIIAIVATRCHILKLKCTKFDLQPFPIPSLDLRGLLLKEGMGGRTGEKGKRGEREGRVMKE